MTTPLTETEIDQFLKQLTSWVWQDNSLKKSFSFTSFREAMSFVLRISYEAEEINHHPEIFNCYNRVEVALNTHDAGGMVTEKDIELARMIENISVK